jgi:hypothetical protein
MALDLTGLIAELDRNDQVDDSAALAITTLMAEVEANKANPAAIQSIVDRVRVANDKLAAAVANTTGSAPSA